jgi:uncharacterized SAM-binding protein YcdF (DUF218 family)/glycosyltransferase involved in cell wall biosynthesis
MSARPVLRGHDFVCISSIDWDFIWQGHQQIMSTLAAEGNRVLFIENTGVRSPRFGDLGRLRHRLVRWWRSTQGFRQERENLWLFSPLIVPLPYSRVARWLNRALLLRAIRRWMRVMGFGRPIVWTFLPTPLARDLLRALDPLVAIYYCIDDLASSSTQARKIEPTERKVFAEADLVFVTSEKLRQRAARFTDRVYLFPFAVDYPKFAGVRDGATPLPEDLMKLSRPVVGFLGGIHQWIDQPLLAEVARRMSDVTFALVGPLQTDVARLTERPNIHLLGARPHTDVPRYLKGFDVAIVPYRLSDYTAHVYPTKLNEYLAMGLSVVATDLPEIRRFNAEHGDIVTVAATAEEFVAGVREALEKTPPAEAARRIEVARENSWDNRIARMSALIDGRLAERDTTRSGWEQTLRQAYRTTRARVVGVAGAALLVYAALFWSPLPWMAAESLQVAAAPGRADAIVVLAGGVGESGRGAQGYQERVKKAVELYRAGRADSMIFSTGWTYTFHEADLMEALALSLGVPAEAIILEKKAASTVENVRFVTAILERHDWHRVLLVSSPYHMRRAILTFRRQAPDIEVVPAPAPGSFFGHADGTNLAQLRAIAHEYLGIAVYWWKGWI